MPIYCYRSGEISTILQKQKGRKRIRNPDNWESKHVKKPGLRKNAPSLTLLQECCKKRCMLSFTENHVQKLRNHFQQLYYEEQNHYLNGLLRRDATKKSAGHEYKSNPEMSSDGNKFGRPSAASGVFSFKYFIRNEKGVDTKICQKAFCNIHGFTRKRLQVLRQKFEQDIGLFDKRGKHSNRVKVSDTIRDMVMDHISSLPARTSHYSRKQNHGRKYLPPELSIARLHKEFKKIHDPEFLQIEELNYQKKILHQPVAEIRKPIVSEHFYHDIFVNEFNIGFGYPRTDTCSTCDTLRHRIECTVNEVDKSKHLQEHEEHQKLAQSGYDTFHNDQERAKSSWPAN